MPPKDAPKGKKKKKTKEELEEERRLAEEAARLAEEERRRQEEEERKRLEELERQRQELLAAFLASEAERLEAERAELEPVYNQQMHERARANAQRQQDWEWERFLSCTHVPQPKDRVAVNDFILLQQAAQDTELDTTLTECEDCAKLQDEAKLFQLEAHQDNNQEAEAMFAKDVAMAHDIMNARIDHMTAHILHHSDEFANDKNEIQLGTRCGSFQWALWINTSKNPRLKSVELPQLSMQVDIPKQIALANIAMRVQHRTFDEFFPRCTNEYMAVGGVLYVDLLALPPPAKKVKGWTLRQVTPLSFNVQRIPYPIPPAGADPATYRSEEEPPPLGFTFPFTPDIYLTNYPHVSVAWWDPESSSWSMNGVTDVDYDKMNGTLTFKSTHIGPLALVQSRARLLPYKAWSVRPTGGRNGSTAAITITTDLPDKIVFEVGPGTCKLVSPSYPEFQSLLDKPMNPLLLLQRLSEHGLHLLPEDRDAQYAGVKVKERSTEEAACMDLALVCGVFLVSSSKWNQAAKADECICRISEVMDWEEGGRTELPHLERIFDKEREDGERRVLAVMRRGVKGWAFTDALDKRSEYPALPGHESVESVQACMAAVFGEIHHSLAALLKGPRALTQSQSQNASGGAGSGQGQGGAAGGGGDAKPPGSAQGDSRPQASGGQQGSDAASQREKDSALLLRLQASSEGLELVRTTNPLLTESLGQLLFALRVFSFS